MIHKSTVRKWVGPNRTHVKFTYKDVHFVHSRSSTLNKPFSSTYKAHFRPNFHVSKSLPFIDLSTSSTAGQTFLAHSSPVICLANSSGDMVFSFIGLKTTPGSSWKLTKGSGSSVARFLENPSNPHLPDTVAVSFAKLFLPTHEVTLQTTPLPDEII